MNETIYISGRMTGTPDLGREQFNDAEKQLRDMGFRVLNPAILPTDLDNAAYMPICFAMLREADAVLILEGWERSYGANLELGYAQKIGKRVFFDVDQLRYEYIGDADGWHDARTSKPPCDEYYHVYMRNDLWDENGDKYIVTVAYYDGDWDEQEKPYIAYWREIDDPKPPANFKPL